MNKQDKIKYLKLLKRKLFLKDNRNDVYKTYRTFKGRFAVLIGGSGSGKSYEVADKQIQRIVTEDGHRILCVRAERKQVTESQFPLLKSRVQLIYEELYNNGEFKINEAAGMEKIVYLPNKSEIIFAGLDDVDKLKSIFDITSVWIEEADQVDFKDFRELNRRLRGHTGKYKNGEDKYMQMSISFNPVSILSWLKNRFFDDLTDTTRLSGNAGFFDFTDAYKVEKADTKTLLIHTTYKDNKFIDDTYKAEMEELKKYDENEYNIYALGHWGITGGTYFDKTAVNNQIQKNIIPIKQGEFEYDYNGISISNIKWIDNPDGAIKIYSEPKPYYPYVMGADTASDGSDWNTGTMIDNTTDEDVATIRINYDEDLFARQMYCLGMMYNTALIGPETNHSTHPLKELQRLGYKKLYVREEAPDATTGKITKKYGVNTNKKTRPLMLGILRQLVRENAECIKDKNILLEMTTFAKNEKGKPEAMQGAHDDMIMARAITCLISGQQCKYPTSIDGKPLNMSDGFFSKPAETQALSEEIDETFINYGGGDDW